MLPSSGFKIGRIFGIDIVINISWIVIFVLISISFGSIFYETSGFPDGALPWVVGFITSVIFFAGLLLHELSHSIVVKRRGIDINRITLWLFGGVAEMSDEAQSPWDEFRMAVAGPLVTFILGGIFGILYLLLRSKNISIVVVAPLARFPSGTWLSVSSTCCPHIPWTAAAYFVRTYGIERVTCAKPQGRRVSPVK